MDAARVIARIAGEISRVTPDVRGVNAVLLGVQFWRHQGRWPLRCTQAGADINDYIVWRAVGPWSDFERVCVDKETAKIVARGLCPGVGVARTVGVCDVSALEFDSFAAWVRGLTGGRVVAKPAHGSGGVVFLDLSGSVGDAALRVLHAAGGKSYFRRWRERQYLGLARKIIVEERLAADRGVLNDYKFFCARGRPLLCQIDSGRFTDQRRALVRVPEFDVLDVMYRYRRPDVPPVRPVHWDEMVACAAALAAPFAFVRVDLYDTFEGVVFGEFTFTPEAGFGRFSDPGLAVEMLQSVVGARPH